MIRLSDVYNGDFSLKMKLNNYDYSLLLNVVFKPHAALCIPDILLAIFSYLDQKNLYKAVQINHQWMELALPVLYSTICIHSRGKIKSLLKIVNPKYKPCKSWIEILDEFLDDCLDDRQCHCRLVTRHGNKWNYSKAKSFNTFGPFIRSLNLQSASDY